MNPMKRVGLVALLVAIVMLLASPPAWGANKKCELVNVAAETDPDAEATGRLVWGPETVVGGDYDGWGFWHELYGYKVTLTCDNLTPGATYRLCGGVLVDFTADTKGRAKVVFAVMSGPPPEAWYYYPDSYVDRLDPDAFWTHVLAGPDLSIGWGW